MRTRTVPARRWLAPAAAAAVGLTPFLAAPAPAATAAAATTPAAAVRWHACPDLSDPVLKAMGVADDVLPRVRAQLDRLQCGTVRVPLDHRRPGGRQIDIGISRLPAVDRAHRLGSLALNPGGPGGSGFLMPVQLQVERAEAADAGLNERYDLIGFDPRGVGHSTKVDCPRTAPPGAGDQQVGPVTREQAAARYDAQVAANAACGNSDPAFLGGLTTANVARDLDRVRAALGERRLNFLGVSWGTWLGAVYRNEFPARVGRMFLDSTAIPRFDLTTFVAVRAAATEADAQRFLAWVAAREATYGLGGTAAEVRTVVRALVSDWDAHPRTFSDLPTTFDGSVVAASAAQPSPAWPLAAQVLRELRTATGPAAPPTLKAAIGGGSADGGGDQPPPDVELPELANPTMGRAAFCNEDTSRPGFEAAWANYQRLLADNPVTGRTGRFDAGCAGWPLPAQPVRLHRVGADVVLSGHRYESVSPYQWTPQMQRITGGRVYTVEDDVHGSALRECRDDIVRYFETGRIDRGCAGLPVPTGTDLPAPPVAAAALTEQPAAAGRGTIGLRGDR